MSSDGFEMNQAERSKEERLDKDDDVKEVSLCKLTDARNSTSQHDSALKGYGQRARHTTWDKNMFLRLRHAATCH